MKALLIVVMCLTVMVLTGCAQVMAISQPKELDRSVLVAGTDREFVVGCLGQPLTHDEATDGTLTETFSVKDGGSANHVAWKTTRVVLYTAGDLVTCWLDQIIWMPLEAVAFCGTKSTIVAHYETQRNGTGSKWALARFEERPN